MGFWTTAASFAAPAATGAAFQICFESLLKAALEMKMNNSMFRPMLERLVDTLKSMESSVKKIETFDRDSDRPWNIDGLKALMNQGERLVLKCSKIHRFNFYKKDSHARKLVKLDDDIRRYIGTILPMQYVVDMKENLFETKQLSNQFRQLSMVAANSVKYGLVGVYSPPGLKVNPVGLEIPLRDLKRKLLKEDIPLIVVSAPGGRGKTTLATALCQDVDIKDKFKDNIFFVTITKSPNLLVIVQRLFQHNGYDVPEFLHEQDLVFQLENLLNKIALLNPILLVLDDVWSESDSLLDKLMRPIENYKILVTSRFEFRRFNSTYKLQALNDADAMTLFRQSASLLDGNSSIPDEHVNKMVKSCKGFPLAISVVGKSLCGRPVAEWRKRVNNWSNAASVVSNDELSDCLQISVDALDDNPLAKECYMDLGSFPEDHRIAATTLVDMWVELHNIDEDDAIANLYELSNRNLVDLVVMRKNASEDDGTYNEHFVMQHDLLRELAMVQSNLGCIEQRKRVFLDITGNKIPEWWMQQKHLSISAKLLSICTDEMFSSSWCSIHAPEVEVLLLNFQTKNYTLPEFIRGMDKLKVLIITNCDFFSVELSNFLLLHCLSNLKRIRMERVSIPSFFTYVQLVKLERISLVMCNIGQAFSNFPFWISDPMPNLVEINFDYCNDLKELPAGICDLVLLKKLSITNCHNLFMLPQEIGKLVNLEVLRLNSCTNLLELPDTIERLHRLSILDLTDCLSLSKLPDGIDKLQNLRKLHMMGCPSKCELPPSVLNVEHVMEVVCDEDTASLWEPFTDFRNNLRIKVHKEDINLNWLYNHRF